MQKPKLLLNTKEFFMLFGLFAFVFLIRIAFLYGQYQEFIAKPFYYTYADVLQKYAKSKENREYTVLKLRSAEYQFYTTTLLKTSEIGKRVRVKLYPDSSLGFLDYLGVFYIKSKIKTLNKEPLSYKERLLEAIGSQHSDPNIISFYQAIFLATPLTQELRTKIASLGVSHLVALSGFHLTILWGLIFGLIHLLYHPLQQRFAPYRLSLLDIGLITIVLLGLYLWFVDSPPSLVRSFVMLFVAWVMLLMGVELLSFELLGVTIMFLIAFEPSLALSYGFQLSIAGVFYIYLLLHYLKTMPPLFVTLFIVPLGIFVLMLPITHLYFGATSSLQLLSPVLSLLFVPFYPSVLLLHFLGLGGVFDGALLQLFTWESVLKDHLLPLWAGVLYILLSLGAMRSLLLFVFLFSLAILYAFFLFGFV